MNRKKILQLIVATSAIASGITLSQDNPVQAATNEVNIIFNSPTAVTGQQGKVVNISTVLRIRSAANSSASIVGYLQNDATVKITGESGDWYQINYNNITCYVSKDYVSVATSSTINTGTSISTTGTIVNVSTNLRVRSGADPNSSIIGYLVNGTKVTITGESGTWYKIQYNNGIGYVSKDYVSVQSTSVPVVATQTVSTSTQNGKVVNVTSNLRVRSAANTSASVLGYLNNGTSVTITGTNGDWYAIKYNNGTGYVSKTYISAESSASVITQTTSTTTTTATSTPAATTTPTTATSTPSSSVQKGKVINVSTNLRVRSSANTSSSVLGYVLNGTVVTITGTSENWYAINFGGKIGYVSKEYIQIVDASTADTSNQSSQIEKVISAMKAQLGSPYVWGGSGEYITKSLLDSLSRTYPSQAANGAYTRAYTYVGSGMKAFDCSGLMQWGYAQAGIAIGRSTWDQVKNGRAISLNDVKPGDLLFYKTLTHVGMYIGDGQWIEAPNKTSNVRITSVPWGNIGQARRIIN